MTTRIVKRATKMLDKLAAAGVDASLIRTTLATPGLNDEKLLKVCHEATADGTDDQLASAAGGVLRAFARQIILSAEGTEYSADQRTYAAMGLPLDASAEAVIEKAATFLRAGHGMQIDRYLQKTRPLV